MTAATIANRKMRFDNSGLADIPEVISISGFGERAELVDVTNLDSAGSKEYIAGLLDGVEFTVECNHLDGNTVQEAIKAAKGTTKTMQYARTDASPETTADFSAVCLGYEESPSVSDQNRITFTFKISGAIT